MKESGMIGYEGMCNGMSDPHILSAIYLSIKLINRADGGMKHKTVIGRPAAPVPTGQERQHY